ncbi:Protein YcgL [Marinomonas spartinae]|uniref:YcgL domain-containing protein MSP8886_02758 n=1 Tax=Marinomonas spartinae TaxID=1792290 RepID=A0A1A8TL29_9GAMM|nr:YcgL domain-containing protein [Marinomonas spartinae]SBS33456.1 Protein YcgL [Marinomonas spartinae]SBS34491.1 Protein YcgL [Marinomonas spartinae]
MKQHLIVEVFRSSKKDGMYLYVEKRVGLKEIPEDLMTRFGSGISAMTMLLTKESKLARANAESVIKDIKEKGFYLQLPPAKEDYLLDLYKTPTEAVY